MKRFETDYHLVVASPDYEWDKFVNDSENGTIFSSSIYLQNSGLDFKLFYIFNKNELRAAISLLESREKRGTIIDDLVIYNGLIYSQPTYKQNNSQRNSEQFRIQEFVANELTCLYDYIEISLHPTVVDIRPFLWQNFGSTMPKYVPQIRFTSYLDISDFRTKEKCEEISVYQQASYSRRQQIRYALKKGYKTLHSNETTVFMDFYKKTFARQGLQVDPGKISRMQKLLDSLLAGNVARIFVSQNQCGENESMAVFCWDSKRAYYLFGASDPSKRSGHGGTAVLWNAFLDLSQMGIDLVDLEGINSPNRGWFKLSFGGNVIPYYELKFSKETDGKP